jgi:hypothetical protein
VDEVWGLASHPSLAQFVTAGWDRLLQLWDGLSHCTVWSKDIEVLILIPSLPLHFTKLFMLLALILRGGTIPRIIIFLSGFLSTPSSCAFATIELTVMSLRVEIRLDCVYKNANRL